MTTYIIIYIAGAIVTLFLAGGHPKPWILVFWPVAVPYVMLAAAAEQFEKWVRSPKDRDKFQSQSVNSTRRSTQPMSTLLQSIKELEKEDQEVLDESMMAKVLLFVSVTSKTNNSL